ncbi:DUF1254 domain-containing protein [Bradyrhizobium sp. BRP14]|nr:DUF1254 domain-containing protein [Bradyrhizobium sp. BRP14]
MGLALSGLNSPSSAEPLSEKEAAKIAQEAYIYLYPLVTMDLTRRQQTNVELDAVPGRNPQNAFSHIRTFPSADWKEVVRPNFDTLYSLAWLDLTKEPVVVSVPDTNERYYLLPMLDMWTDVFAVPGKRTTGTAAGKFAIVPPAWKGDLPADVQRVDAPTPYVWVIGRTQTNGPDDYAAVNKIQDGMSISTLSQRGNEIKTSAARIDPGVDMKTPPLAQVNAMPADKYFAYAAELMKVNAPHLTDWSIVARMKKIGIEPGKSFDASKLDAVVRKALHDSPAAGLKLMQAKLPTMARVTNGWQMNTDTMGVYGNYYLKRAIIALVGLGANQPEDAIYPLNIADADGEPLNGADKYTMHFDKSELPPVDAFWSLTMYDAEGFQVANPINRYAIGDRDKLKYNDDGSLDLYIQSDSPGPDKEANWLPSPRNGVLGITMRLYAPRAEVVDGLWNPPPVKKVN